VKKLRTVALKGFSPNIGNHTEQPPQFRHQKIVSPILRLAQVLPALFVCTAFAISCSDDEQSNPVVPVNYDRRAFPNETFEHTGWTAMSYTP